MTYEHKDVPANKGANHVPYDWTYANAAARTGASGFVSADIGKLARQTDNNTLWMLTAATPAWVPVGAGSAFMQTLMDDADAATARATLGANIWRTGGLLSFNTTQTLSASHLGKHLHTFNSPTLTLPPFSVCENGSMLLISCYSGVTTISRNGTEPLFTTSSVTSFTLNPGDFAILTTNGVTSWIAMICRATVAQVSPKILTFTRDLSAAPGTQTVDHNAGFNPSLILFMSAYDGMRGCFGWSDGSINLCFYNQDGTLRGPYTYCIVAGLDVTNYQIASVSAKSSSSFTLTWTKYGYPTATFPFYALLIP